MNLDELLAQRKAVAQHLEWLDAQIDRARGGSYSADAYTPQDSGSFTEDLADNAIELGPYGRQHPYGLSPSQKVGCIGILFLIAVGFLSIIFILPNLIYD